MMVSRSSVVFITCSFVLFIVSRLGLGMENEEKGEIEYSDSSLLYSFKGYARCRSTDWL